LVHHFKSARALQASIHFHYQDPRTLVKPAQTRVVKKTDPKKPTFVFFKKAHLKEKQ